MDNKKLHLESLEYLQNNLPAGSEVFTIQRHVSANGMLRYISVLAVIDGKIEDITYRVFHLEKGNNNKYCPEKNGYRALRVPGCGMDLGFHVVHNLSYALHGYPQDRKDAERTGEPQAGYTLKHRWL